MIKVCLAVMDQWVLKASKEIEVCLESLEVVAQLALKVTKDTQVNPVNLADLVSPVQWVLEDLLELKETRVTWVLLVEMVCQAEVEPVALWVHKVNAVSLDKTVFLVHVVCLANQVNKALKD